MKPLIIDGHLDLSMNAMEWNRDLTMPVRQIRTLEEGMDDKPDRGKNTVSLPAMREGNIGMCIATLIGRYAKPSHPLGGWRSPSQAWSMIQGQLAWYREMERLGEITQIVDTASLNQHVKLWDTEPGYQSIGYLMSLEGADSILSEEHLQILYDQGLRAIGPAHYGPGTYAYGTNSDGSIGEKGKWLISAMSQLGITLDVTHLSETSFWEALEAFEGEIWASHSNCHALVPHNRQFTDEQLKTLIERNAIIGLPLDAWMMTSKWKRGWSTPENTPVTLEDMLDHMVHICTLAGNTSHVAIGTDLDGGFGKEQSPVDIDTIADLQQLPQLLKKRGFEQEDIDRFLHHNWLNKIKTSLQESVIKDGS